MPLVLENTNRFLRLSLAFLLFCVWCLVFLAWGIQGGYYQMHLLKEKKTSGWLKPLMPHMFEIQYSFEEIPLVTHPNLGDCTLRLCMNGRKITRTERKTCSARRTSLEPSATWSLILKAHRTPHPPPRGGYLGTFMQTTAVPSILVLSSPTPLCHFPPWLV